METFVCHDGCCTIKIVPYTSSKDPSEKIRQGKRKAGVFIYDPISDKVLLVQSRGNLWGPPKGTMQYGETERLCAVREVKEETGLQISDDDFSKALKIYNRAIYYYIEKPECDVKVQTNVYKNDANGISWIKPSCLEKCIVNGNICLSQHCRMTFRRFLNKEFPHSTFVLVGKKKCMSKFL